MKPAGPDAPTQGFASASAGLGLMALPFIYTMALLAAPILIIVSMSFWTQNDLVLDRSMTVANYVAAWTEPLYRTLVARSLWISATVTVVTVVTAFPLAYYVSFHVTRRKGLWLFLLTVPFWTSYLLRVFAWKVILGNNGVLNTGLIAAGIIDQPLEWLLYNANAVIITLAHAWAPFAILPIYASLEKIDRSLLEAATDLGDGPFARFWRVTLPLAMPGVLAACLIVFIPTVGDYVTPRLVGGKDGTMIANLIQVQFGRGSNWPLGAALSVSTMAIVAAIAMLLVLAARRFASRPS